MFWTCVGDVCVGMFRTCVGHGLDMCWLCFEHVFVMFWTCFEFVVGKLYVNLVQTYVNLV